MKKGKISIGKVTSSRCGEPTKEFVRIEVEDELSFIRFVEVRIGVSDFANALFGLGNVPARYRLSASKNIGRKLEVKCVEVRIPLKKGLVHKAGIRKAIAKYEVDGWMGRDVDAENWHNLIAGTKAIYRVSFHRYVNPPKPKQKLE